MKCQTKEIISAGNVANNLTSETIDLRFNYGVFIQASFTGSPSGTVVLQGSNDESNWSTLDSVSISGTTLLSINKDAIYSPYIRVYKAAGGTGSMTVTASIKGA